ncbi:MAG: hypothetical protein WBC72_16680 [Pseudolabrys sp.]
MEDHWQAGYGDAVRSLGHLEVLQRPDRLEAFAHSTGKRTIA